MRALWSGAPSRSNGVFARASCARGMHLEEQRDQRMRAALRAPVPVHLRIEAGAFGQRVGGKEMLARPEQARAAVLQPDFHLAAQDENPLRLRRAVPLAAEAYRAVAQLIAGGREDR